MRFLRSFFKYYKWQLFFLILVVVCVVFALSNITQYKDPDVSICYVGKNYINVQTFNDNKSNIELIIRDANGDNEKFASLTAYPVDLESDLHEVFEKLVDQHSFDLFIADKTAFTKYADTSIFRTVSQYLNLSEKPLETLTDDSGRAFAVALEDIDYAKSLGIVDATDLYIAVPNPWNDGDFTQSLKNGKNLAEYILTQN